MKDSEKKSYALNREGSFNSYTACSISKQITACSQHIGCIVSKQLIGIVNPIHEIRNQDSKLFQVYVKVAVSIQKIKLQIL